MSKTNVFDWSVVLGKLYVLMLNYEHAQLYDVPAYKECFDLECRYSNGERMTELYTAIQKVCGEENDGILRKV